MRQPTVKRVSVKGGERVLLVSVTANHRSENSRGTTWDIASEHSSLKRALNLWTNWTLGPPELNPSCHQKKRSIVAVDRVLGQYGNGLSVAFVGANASACWSNTMREQRENPGSRIRHRHGTLRHSITIRSAEM